MEKQKYLNDLQEIKSMMDRSSRFLSLSGLSGIVAGSLGLLGVYIAYIKVYSRQDYLGYRPALLSSGHITSLLGIATVLLLSAIGAGWFLTRRKALKNNQRLSDPHARRLLINLAIPLVAGGTLCIILLFKGLIGLLAPLTLLFYGLALVNASKYTLTEVRSLGLIEIALGLLACQFIGYGLLFWAIGFGVLHIIYGIVMHVKYGA